MDIRRKQKLKPKTPQTTQTKKYKTTTKTSTAKKRTKIRYKDLIFEQKTTKNTQTLNKIQNTRKTQEKTTKKPRQLH